MMRRLPPFFALRALEAAGRHRSYSRAADELAVTHSAVSQQIRRLEAELGARLFERRGNAMEPTVPAQRLGSAVARAILVLRTAMAEFAEESGRDPLVLSIEPLLARRWLAVHLARLLAAPTGAGLEIRVEDRLADFTTDGADVGVRFGSGRWPGLEAAPLMPMIQVPVASPTLAAAHPVRTPADLLGLPLLHRTHRPWSRWFAAFGLEAPREEGLAFEDTLLLLEAAAHGLGVALAPRGLIDPELSSGRLVRLLDAEVVSDLGFFVVWRSDSRKLGRIHALRDWLTAAAGAPDWRQPADCAA